MKSHIILPSDVSDFSAFHGIEQELISLPIPESTNYYRPVSHRELMETVFDEIAKEGFTINSRRYVANKDRSKVIAYYGIESGDGRYSYQIGWRNSYDKSLSVGFVTGLEVRICGNGCLFGDYKFRKRHQGDVNNQLRDAIHEHVVTMNESYEQILTDFNGMKLRQLTKKEMAELAGRMFIECEIINPNQLSSLKAEILNPTFDYSDVTYNFENSDMYSLYQHLTYVLKDSHPLTNAKQLAAAHKFITEEMVSY